VLVNVSSKKTKQKKGKFAANAYTKTTAEKNEEGALSGKPGGYATCKKAAVTLPANLQEHFYPCANKFG